MYINANELKSRFWINSIFENFKQKYFKTLGGYKNSYFSLSDITKLRLFYVLTKYLLVYANVLVSKWLQIITPKIYK